MTSQRLGLLGGTFDPAHAGHIKLALGVAAAQTLDTVYLLPCAQHALGKLPGANAAQRLAMLQLAVDHSDRSRLAIDEREMHRAGKSYTINSCREIRAELGGSAKIGFIVGSDLLDSLHHWKDWEAIFDYVNLIVVDRAVVGVAEIEAQEAPKTAVEYRQCHPVQAVRQRLDAAVLQMNSPHGELVRVTLPPVPVSSTAVRHLLASFFQRSAEQGIEPASIVENGRLGCGAGPTDLLKLRDRLLEMVDRSVLSYIIANELYRD